MILLPHILLRMKSAWHIVSNTKHSNCLWPTSDWDIIKIFDQFQLSLQSLMVSLDVFYFPDHLSE